MSIELNNESTIRVDEARLVRLSNFALGTMHVSAEAELSVVLVDEAAIEQLHLQWMDASGPTDVLSFPIDELRPGTAEELSPAGLLGDIVLCPQVAQAQADAAGHSMMDELLLLATHGILHLLGFDHAEPEEKREMFGLQGDILMGFHIAERQA